MAIRRLGLAAAGMILVIGSVIGLGLSLPEPPQTPAIGDTPAIILSDANLSQMPLVLPPANVAATPYRPQPLPSIGPFRGVLAMHVNAAWQQSVWLGEASKIDIGLDEGLALPGRTTNGSLGRLTDMLKVLTAPRNARGLARVRVISGSNVLATSEAQQFFDGQNAILPLDWSVTGPSAPPGGTTTFQIQMIVQWRTQNGASVPNAPDRVVWQSTPLSTTTRPVPKALPVSLSVLALPSGLGLLAAALRGRATPGAIPDYIPESKTTLPGHELPTATDEIPIAADGETSAATGSRFAFCACRWRDGDSDASLRIGLARLLQVAVRAQPEAGTLASAPIDLGSERPVQLRVVVYGENMDVSPRVQMLDVPASRNSPWIEFAITPRKAGQWRLQVEFFYQLNWLQTMNFTVQVIPAEEVLRAPRS